MVVRYMGTKRHMADRVREAIADLGRDGRVVDLFSGMGSVAESLRETASVVTNDALSFTAAISRARFTGPKRTSSAEEARGRLAAVFEGTRAALESKYSRELADEEAALNANRDALARYMNSAQHAGNSPQKRKSARAAAEAGGSAHYELASLYFGAGYLSLRQAIEVDAIRAAVDGDAMQTERDWLLGSWIAAASVLLNAPGHTAQFLRPNSSSAHARIVRTWRRSMWDEFLHALDVVTQVGDEAWRANNTVYVGDALDLISAGELRQVGVVYADPPYTKDQYSRYYHVYETLYRYDYPDASGAGRNRSDRFTTGFSLKSAVVASFNDLCRNVSRMNVPLVISYPSTGLLEQAGGGVQAIADKYFEDVKILSYDAKHSTMGASKGDSKKSVTENLYVCTP